MYFATALAAGALALQATAFLIPPELVEFAKSGLNLPKPVPIGAVHTVELQCKDCPFAGVDKTDKPWAKGVQNSIHLELSVDPSNGLLLNGQTLVPSHTSSGHPEPIFAPQVREIDGKFTKPLPLDLALESLEMIPYPAEAGAVRIPMQLTILGLEGHSVKVDTVVFDVIHTPGETRIENIDMIPFNKTPGADSCKNSSKWSLCRLRAIITARLQTLAAVAKSHAKSAKGWFKGDCGGSKAGAHPHRIGKFGGKHRQHAEDDSQKGPHGHHKGHHKGQHHENHENHEHHGHHGHHGPHRHHNRLHRLRHMFHQALRFVVIPALLGIIGGLMASAIGMLVGQFIVFLWLRFRRSQRRSSPRVVEIVVHEDEKDALLVDELPPHYEDVEGVVVTEDKN